MIELIYVVVAFGAGFWIGKMYVLYTLRKIIAKFIVTIDNEVDASVHKLRTEATPDSILLYNEQGGFVCQGKTIDELAALADKQNGIKYAAVMHDEKIVLFIDGVVKEAV